MNRVAQLTVLKDGVEVKNHLIEGSVVLGRGKESDLRLEDQAISRQHAVFSFKGDQLFVEKKSEFGHLQVNGADLSTSELKNNDILMIGSFLIRVSIPSGSAQDSQSSQASGDSRSPQESVESKASPLPPSDEKQPSGVQPKPVLEPSQVQAQGHLDPLESAEEPPVPGEKNPGGLQDDPFAQDSDQALDSPAVGLESVDSQESVESQDPLESLGSSENSDEPPLQGSSENSADAELPELKLEGSGFQENSGESVESSQMISDDAKTRVLGLSALSVRLVFPLGSANCTEYEIEKNEVIIGRGKDCDIVLNDKKASRKNTVVRRAGVNFVIEDLDSSNGTYVNGEKIKTAELSADDEIRIGSVQFHFKATNKNYTKNEQNFLPVPAIEEEVVENEGDFAAQSNPFDLALSESASPSPSGQIGRDSSLNKSQNGIPSFPSQSSIVGIGPQSSSKKTLLERFRELPKRTQMILSVAIILFLGFLLEEEEVPLKKSKGPKPQPSPAVSSLVDPSKNPLAVMSFETLSPDQKSFVEAQHTLAFDLYRNKEYDKCLFELDKIFKLIPEYKDSREIQRYAREGKRKLEAQEEERRKKEEEQKRKEKLDALIEDAKQRMIKKQFDVASELFTQILALDPDNVMVATWRKELEEDAERKKQAALQKEVIRVVNQKAWEAYREAQKLAQANRCRSAIAAFKGVMTLGATDSRILVKSKQGISLCRETIRAELEPVLAEAKSAEVAGEFSKAYDLFRKATRINPDHPEGYAGMNRIRGVLHDRAKQIYTEAILAESYSDFENAKRLFKECLDAAPVDDIYHERSLRKLSHYFQKKEQASP